MERRTREALNDAWRSSKRQRQQFDVRPKQVTMLRALYLGQDTAGEVERVGQRLRPVLENLASREHWRRLAECGADGKVELTEFASFPVEGTKVFALPDLAYVHRGTLHVVDWKSGRRSEGHQTQVLLSSFWALSTPAGREAPATTGHLEYLAEGVDVTVDIAEDLAERVSAIVQAGVRGMRELLRDPASNAPLGRESFAPRESGLCRTCNFLPLCERHRRAEA
jgi:PD-(D/E)XK nuclease superfamily